MSFVLRSRLSIASVKDTQGNFTGDVYIEYFLPDYASNAAEAHQREPIQVNGSPVWLEYFKQSLTALRPSPTLHVSGLPDNFTMPEIRSSFERFGPIQNARFGQFSYHLSQTRLLTRCRSLYRVSIHRLRVHGRRAACSGGSRKESTQDRAPCNQRILRRTHVRTYG